MTDPLVGTWELVSWRNEAADGSVTYPMGADPLGFIVYSNDGHIAAHLGRPGREPFSAPDMAAGTPEENMAAMRSHISYVGTYEFHGDHVVHHVKLSSFPNWTGTDQRRTCTFEGDTLLLAGDPMEYRGQTVVAYALWRRVRP